jgi:hypothetical protein
VSDNSVGGAPVSAILYQAEADLAHRGALESPLDSKPGPDLQFDKPLGVGYPLMERVEAIGPPRESDCLPAGRSEATTSGTA